MSELRFTVLGKPQPAGSKRAFAIKTGGQYTGRVAVTDANKNAAGWKAEVRFEAAQQMRFSRPVADAVSVSLTFYCARPKSHYRTGKNAHLLKDAAPPLPTGRPDSLKLARGTEDAMTGVVYVDDAQVVDLDVHKRYGVPERCEVVIRFTPLPEAA